MSILTEKFLRAPGSQHVVQGVRGIEGARHADQGLTPEQIAQLGDAAGKVTKTIIDAVTGEPRTVVVPPKKDPPYLMIAGLLVLGFIVYKKL
jgi:hypothetical protein